nr:unnamed protein product [Spirometra erinaceieuropaei]
MVYRPPRNDPTADARLIEDLKRFSSRSDVLIVRDFNAHHIDWSSAYASGPDHASDRRLLDMTLKGSPHSDQHLLTSDAEEGDLNAPSVATLAPAGLRPRPEAKPARRAGDKGDPWCRRMDRPSPRHLEDKDPLTTSQKTSSRRRVHFWSRVSTTTSKEFLFIGECALNEATEGNTQSGMDFFATACGSFGLIINTVKTVVVHQPPPNATYSDVENTRMKAASTLAYRGSILSCSTKLNDEVPNGIFKASQASYRLQNTDWDSHGLQPRVKLKMYKNVVLLTLLYGAETWTVY